MKKIDYNIERKGNLRKFKNAKFKVNGIYAGNLSAGYVYEATCKCHGKKELFAVIEQADGEIYHYSVQG